MIRAHRLRFIGGGLGGPLRNLPQESVARAKPALEPEHSTLGRANSHPLLGSRRRGVPRSSAGFAGATNPGGRFRKGGEAPLRVERTGSTPRVRPSGAALQLGPSHRSDPVFSDRLPGYSERGTDPRSGGSAMRRLVGTALSGLVLNVLIAGGAGAHRPDQPPHQRYAMGDLQ